MGQVEEILAKSFDSGEMTEAEPDKVMSLIHRDGRIDEQEKEILSRLFSAIQSGAIRLISGGSREAVRTSGQASRALDGAKRRAIEDDEQRLSPKKTAEEEIIAAKSSRESESSAAAAGSTLRQSAVSGAEQDKGFVFGEVAPGKTPEMFTMKPLSRREDGPPFKLETERLLDVNLKGKVWIKTGSMVAYYGLVKFTREGFTEHGVTKFLKRAITGEGTPLTKASGHGVVYLADQGKKISVIELVGHSLVVNGKNILAFEESVSWDITYLRQIAAMWAGGFFNVRLSGKGLAAITTHFDPIVLRVTPTEPLMTDLNATVAWSGSLAPQVKTDISMRTLIGRTSGESVQMRFEGDGFVVIQPYEELFVERELSDDKSGTK
jgi:uncharacterized protein (AIM24 family)